MFQIVIQRQWVYLNRSDIMVPVIAAYIQLKLVQFKKNVCVYTFSYVQYNIHTVSFRWYM